VPAGVVAVTVVPSPLRLTLFAETLPKVTVGLDVAEQPETAMVTRVPPAAGPTVGLIDSIVSAMIAFSPVAFWLSSDDSQRTSWS
jgi:hypothetical protein